MNAAEIIKKDLDAIYIGNLSTVDDDLTLPENGKYGAQFTWETGEERFIDNTGKVHRPLHGMGNRKVTLTVTATYEGCSESREYVATVLQEAKENIVKEVRKFLTDRIACLNAEGFDNIILDPGFGFGKTLAHNYELMNGLEHFQDLGYPLLVGISRKSMIYKLLGNSPAEALNGTAVLNTVSLLKGANILRVHDVGEACEAVKIFKALSGEM